jgi:hypothetical protein
VSTGPLFEPFLDWLYKQPLEDLRSLGVPEGDFNIRFVIRMPT